MEAKTVMAIADEGGEFCDFCDEYIPPGDPFSFTAGTDGEDFYFLELCLTCSNIYSEAAYEANDSVTATDVREYLKDTICDNCEKDLTDCGHLVETCPRIRARYGNQNSAS